MHLIYCQKRQQKVYNALNASYNVQKADWKNFIKNLQSNHSAAKLKMQTLSQSLNIENMNKMTILLRSTIKNAIKEHISKRRSCNQLKVWWSKDLTEKRKFIIYLKRQWKNFKIQSDWKLSKRSRNGDFKTIREAKNKSWTNFLNNAKNKEVFQVYKYTKSRNIEKLFSISHNDGIKIHFEEKCNALIEAFFSFSLENV